MADHLKNPELLAFGEAIRVLIKAGEALSMFSPKGCDPATYRREAEPVRHAWDEALRAYKTTPTTGVLDALTAPAPPPEAVKGGALANILDPLITVCASCARASCWQGYFMCEDSKKAGTTEKRKSELAEMALESSDYWKVEAVPAPAREWLPGYRDIQLLGDSDPAGVEMRAHDGLIYRVHPDSVDRAMLRGWDRYTNPRQAEAVKADPGAPAFLPPAEENGIVRQYEYLLMGIRAMTDPNQDEGRRRLLRDAERFLECLRAAALPTGADPAPRASNPTGIAAYPICMHGVYKYPGNDCGYCAAEAKTPTQANAGGKDGEPSAPRALREASPHNAPTNTTTQGDRHV